MKIVNVIAKRGFGAITIPLYLVTNLLAKFPVVDCKKYFSFQFSCHKISLINKFLIISLRCNVTKRSSWGLKCLMQGKETYEKHFYGWISVKSNVSHFSLRYIRHRSPICNNAGAYAMFIYIFKEGKNGVCLTGEILKKEYRVELWGRKMKYDGKFLLYLITLFPHTYKTFKCLINASIIVTWSRISNEFREWGCCYYSG